MKLKAAIEQVDLTFMETSVPSKCMEIYYSTHTCILGAVEG